MPYMLNGDLLEVSGEPKVKDGTMWVPLRNVATALGANVDWDSSTGVAIIYFNDDVLTVEDGDPTVDFNNEKTELQAAPYVENGEFWVPVRLFENPLNFTLNADPQNGIVDLTTNV